MAHLGNTIVNGALRVLGQTTEDALQVTSINGVTVGASPKFTDTNNKVTQTATTANAAYEVLFSETADNTTRTEGARKTTTLRFNPSTGSLMEGQSTVASGTNSHAEGSLTTANGTSCHAEGGNTKSVGDYCHSEGYMTTAINGSHAEGNRTIASKQYSHSEGYKTEAKGDISHAEGSSTTASGENSHSEGSSTSASGNYSHAEGYGTTASGQSSHAEGYNTLVVKELYSSMYGSHAEGYQTTCGRDGSGKHAEGFKTSAYGTGSHSEGVNTVANGNQGAHAEGESTTASGLNSHAEGYQTIAQGKGSHAEGQYACASGSDSHAEGNATIASDDYSHAEGWSSCAAGIASHAEGEDTKASGLDSHAEGIGSIASGDYSHAEGYYTTASGADSHASGLGTSAGGLCQFVIGHYNVADEDSLFIIGNGSGNTSRSNALRIDSSGNFYTNKLMKVYKNTSVSTSTTGTWTAMCNTADAGSPTLPTSSKWWNVINLNNWTDSCTDWVSQLAICTRHDPNSGVWWRCNDSLGTNISNSTWHRLADGENNGLPKFYIKMVGVTDTAWDEIISFSKLKSSYPYFWFYQGSNLNFLIINPCEKTITISLYLNNDDSRLADSEKGFAKDRLTIFELQNTGIFKYFSFNKPYLLYAMFTGNQRVTNSSYTTAMEVPYFYSNFNGYGVTADFQNGVYGSSAIINNRVNVINCYAKFQFI